MKVKKMYLFDYINYAIFILFAIITVYPLYYVFIGSFNEGLDYLSGGVYLLPRKYVSDNYAAIFADSKLWNAYFITISRTIIGTVTALFFTSAVSYALSRKDMPFKNLIYWLNIFTMFFSGGLVPFFLVIKALGLYNSYLLYVIPCIYSVYHMIIIANFFRSLPEELHESAVIDGANEYKIFFKIYVPLSKPALVTVALWIAVGHWNSYYDTMVYTSKESLWTLQFYLLKLINSSGNTVGTMLPPEIMETMTTQSMTYAAIIVSVLPIICVFPFVSKYFDKGIIAGSLKG